MKVIAEFQLKPSLFSEDDYCLVFKCGALKFNFEIAPGEVVKLLRGMPIFAVSDFEPIIGSKKHFIRDGRVVLDAETLAMRTQNKDP